MKDFLISYTETDHPWAEWIAWVLEESGYTVELSVWQPDETVTQVWEQLVDFNRGIALLSKNYLKQVNAAAEKVNPDDLDRLIRERKLIPIRVSECKPAGWPAKIAYLDLIGKSVVEAERAIETLAQLAKENLAVEIIVAETERAIGTIAQSAEENHEVKPNLDQMWQEVLAVLQPPSTQALFRQQGRLLALTEKQARIGILSQPLFKVAQLRVPNLEAALAQLCQAHIKVSLEVAAIKDGAGAKDTENQFQAYYQTDGGCIVQERRRQSVQFFVEQLTDDLGIEMILIPAGTFVMGSPEDELDRSTSEGPQHEVSVPTFFVGKYPVTQAQWRFVAELPQVDRELNPAPSYFKGDKRPVEQVSWYDAIEFCARLSAHTGRDYRLPSEAEWEYACRASRFRVGVSKIGEPIGGVSTPFHFGETITTDLANYRGTDEESFNWSGSYNRGPKGEYRQETSPTDHFKIANAFGLCDMHGNVWEWCQDHWHDNYNHAPTDGSAWLSESDKAYRVRRGGSWNNNPRLCRSAFRGIDTPENRERCLGFRVVCRGRTGNSSVPTGYSATDDLFTDKGIDYTKLRDLLAAGKWKEADEETWKVMLQVTEKTEYLFIGDVKQIPNADLHTIDRLWVKYSRGKFGFSVQKRIWYEVNQDWQQFTERVGWRESGNDLKQYDALTFNLNAPVGHLPYQFGTPDQCWVWGRLGMGSTIDYLLSRQDL